MVSNDDGIFSPGIHALARAMSSIASEVLVVAPDVEQSGMGHAITLQHPLRYKPTRLNDLPSNVSAYRVDGTPADCVMLGISNGGKPDVVVSGINLGYNLGYDIKSSGTVAAAWQGCSRGVPSVAFSLQSGDELDFGPAAEFAAKLVPEVAGAGLPEHTLLNVNVPLENPKGVHLTKQSGHNWDDRYVERYDPGGKPYYWLTGELQETDDPDSDARAVREGFISVTPLHIDMTHLDYFSELTHIVPGLQLSQADD